jgi:predicted acetyltransferase
VSIRHRLNDWLLAHGGHIGYGILPEFRRQGFATQILEQSLIIARALGIDRALLTCDDDNIGSIRVIEGCGGHLDEQWPTTPGPVPMRRYWID